MAQDTLLYSINQLYRVKNTPNYAAVRSEFYSSHFGKVEEALALHDQIKQSEVEMGETTQLSRYVRAMCVGVIMNAKT